MIGGSGERKTLRLVAKYADACNIFGTPEAEHKLDVLREHCEAEQRSYDDIEKTTIVSFDGSTGDAGPFVEQLRALHDLGFTAAYVFVQGPDPFAAVDVFGRAVVPEIAGW